MQLPKLSERHRMQYIYITPKTPIDTGKGDRERKSVRGGRGDRKDDKNTL